MDKYHKDFPRLEFKTDGEMKLYRCKHCAEYKQAIVTFGKWSLWRDQEDQSDWPPEGLYETCCNEVTTNHEAYTGGFDTKEWETR